MSILGTANSRDFRGVTLVVYHVSLDTTEWLIREVEEAVAEAKDLTSGVSLFVLVDEMDDDLGDLPNRYELTKLKLKSKSWIPSVLKNLAQTGVVISAGLRVNRKLARVLPSDAVYLPILMDRLDELPYFLPRDQQTLESVSEKARTVFFSSETARSNAETLVTSLCERTIVFGPELGEQRDDWTGFMFEQTELIQTTMSLTDNVNRLLQEISHQLREFRIPPATTVIGTPQDEERFLAGQYGDVRFVPGVTYRSQMSESPFKINRVMIIDDSDTEFKWRISQAQANGAVPLLLSKVDGKKLVEILTSKAQIPAAWVASQSFDLNQVRLSSSLARILKPNLAASESVTRVVLAGSDFKFGAMLIRELEEASDIEWVLDRSRSNTSVEPLHSERLGEWADVVITEFLTEQAIWYSKNLLPGRRLIVHMHGFELYKDLSDRLNIDGVYRVVVPSEGYRKKVLEKKKWPEDKVIVIHNGGSLNDLLRPKESDARFTLGLVGWVPALKRIDRALDLLEFLIEKDPRYTLEVRGASPWNYKWEWEQPAHRDMYMNVLERLRDNRELSSRVTFAPFGADMGNWLRGIGWMISSSVRESFHLAPVEGMLSGSIPIVWEREGARDIYGDAWVHENTLEAAKFVLRKNASELVWKEESNRALDIARQRYDDRVLRKKWHDLIVQEEDRELDAFQTVFADQSKKIARDIFGFAELSLTADIGYNLAKDELSSESQLAMPPFLLSLQDKLTRRSIGKETSGYLDLQIASGQRKGPRLDCGSSGTVLLSPPDGTGESDYYRAEDFARFAPTVPVISPQSGKLSSMVDYLEISSRELQKQSKLTGSRNFIVDGPYWALIAAIHASVNTGGHVVWDLRHEPILNTVSLRSSHLPITDDPLDFVSKVVADNIHWVLVDDLAPIPSVILEIFSREQIVREIPTTTGSTRKVPITSERIGKSWSIPTISVVIPSDQTGATLKKTLDSLMKQSFPKDFIEILIVRNGPENQRESWVDNYAQQHPKVAWHIISGQSGAVGARNRGLDYATGDFVTFIEEGDVVGRNYLTSMVVLSSSATIVASQTADLDSTGSVKNDTYIARRVKALGLGRVRAQTQPALLGVVWAKLIPREFLESIRFRENLTDGYDIAFLGELVSQHDLYLVAAYPMSDSAYIRTSSAQIYAQGLAAAEQLVVQDRLKVGYHLWDISDQLECTSKAEDILKGLVRPQITVMGAGIRHRPELEESLNLALAEYPSQFVEYVRTNLAE